MSWANLDIEKVSRAWDLAMRFSKSRIQTVCEMDDEALQVAINDGRLILETTCLFFHACVRPGQYKLPLDFWRLLHAECGILIYPSAWTHEVDIIPTNQLFTSVYIGHITMGPWTLPTAPPDPFEYLQEPPPVYEKECSCHHRRKQEGPPKGGIQEA